MNLVRSGALAGFKQLVSSYGQNPVGLIRQAGLSDALLRRPDSYISYSKMALLLEIAASHCDAPLFGLELASRNAPGVLGDLPATVSGEESVGRALEKLGRFIYLMAKGVKLNQVYVGDRVRVHLLFDVDSPMGIQQLLQLSTAHLANIVAGLTGKDRLALPLYLRQPRPEAVLAAGQYRYCHFGSDFDGLLLSAELLHQQPVFDQATVQYYLSERLRALQSQHPDSLPSQVRNIIAQLLPFGECCIEVVAATLDLQPRMLQIKLKAEQTTYQQLLRETRQAVAEETLKYTDMPLTDLALNLGFADIAVFSRSFKAWTGIAPSDWRKRCRQQALPDYR